MNINISLLASSCVGELKHAVQFLTHPSAQFSFPSYLYGPLLNLRVIIYFNFRPKTLVQIVVKTTILIELKGIKMAATTGSNCPVTAK